MYHHAYRSSRDARQDIPLPGCGLTFTSCLVRESFSPSPLFHSDSSKPGLVGEQLQLLATDLRRTAASSQLTTAYFREITESLSKLSVHCLPNDASRERMNRLLMIIARPARLLECLEFNPEDPVSMVRHVRSCRLRGQWGQEGAAAGFVTELICHGTDGDDKAGRVVSMQPS